MGPRALLVPAPITEGQHKPCPPTANVPRSRSPAQGPASAGGRAVAALCRPRPPKGRPRGCQRPPPPHRLLFDSEDPEPEGGGCGFGPTPGHVYRRKAPETFREMSSHGRIYFGGSPPLLLGVPRRAGWGEASSPTGLGKWPAPVPSTDPRPAPTPDRASLSGLPFAG